MAKTNQQIIDAGNVIKNETVPLNNTAERIGTQFVDQQTFVKEEVIDNLVTDFSGGDGKFAGAVETSILKNQNELLSIITTGNIIEENIDPLTGKGIMTNIVYNQYNVYTLRSTIDTNNDCFVLNAKANDIFVLLLVVKTNSTSIKSIKFTNLQLVYKGGNIICHSVDVNLIKEISTQAPDTVILFPAKFVIPTDQSNVNVTWTAACKLYDFNDNEIVDATIFNVDSFFYKETKIGSFANSKAIKNRFNAVKNNIPIPFSSFQHLKVLYDNANYPTQDWRSTYVGLGYDIVYDKNTGNYIMLYCGYNDTSQKSSFGFAYSKNLTDWTDYPLNPIFEPTGVEGDPDRGGVTFPQLIWHQDRWIMYYVALTNAGFEQGEHTICHATSTDLINWTRHGVVLSPSDFQAAGYNVNVMYRPRVRCFFGRYYMFINAGASDAIPGGASESIYVAVSDNPINDWKVTSKIIDADKLYIGESYRICSDPDVIFNGELFLMAFWSGGDIIRFAYSRIDEFPHTWHIYDASHNLTGAIRPLFVTTEDNIYMLAGNAHVMSIYSSIYT